jgi:hypothetical protein
VEEAYGEGMEDQGKKSVLILEEIRQRNEREREETDMGIRGRKEEEPKAREKPSRHRS